MFSFFGNLLFKKEENSGAKVPYEYCVLGASEGLGLISKNYYLGIDTTSNTLLKFVGPTLIYKFLIEQ